MLVSEMIALYCRKQHKTPKGQLCPACQELQDYALARIDKCPFMETKTFCSACKVHCYKPAMREQIRALGRSPDAAGAPGAVRETCGGDPQGKTGSAKNGCIIARQTGHPVCREVINMENIGVTCDVCACCHNVAGCKCDLPQIKVTEQCTCNTQQEGTPHYCQNYEEK